MSIETRLRIVTFLSLTWCSLLFLNLVRAHTSHTWPFSLTMKIDLLSVITLWRLHNLAEPRWTKHQCQSLYILILWSLESVWSQFSSSAGSWFGMSGMGNAKSWFHMLSMKNSWSQLTFWTDRSGLMSSVTWLEHAVSCSHCWHIADSANSWSLFAMCLTTSTPPFWDVSSTSLLSLLCMYNPQVSKLLWRPFLHIHFSDSKFGILSSRLHCVCSHNSQHAISPFWPWWCFAVPASMDHWRVRIGWSHMRRFTTKEAVEWLAARRVITVWTWYSHEVVSHISLTMMILSMTSLWTCS